MICKLQKVRNAAARLICRSARPDMSPILCVLHWLPVESRIQYKIIILTFKSSNSQALFYLSDLIQLCIPSRQPSIRLSIPRLLIVSRRLTSSLLVDFVFFYQSLLLWSNLPYTLRHSSYISLVKSTLKTHVFSTGECVGWGGGGGGRARACLYSK